MSKKTPEPDQDIPDVLVVSQHKNQTFIVVAPEKVFLHEGVKDAPYAHFNNTIVTLTVANGKVVYRLEDENSDRGWYATRLYSDLRSMEEFI